jgi:hypothetical protein
MRRWKQPFVNATALFSIMAEFLNSCQDRTRPSVALGITMKNNDYSVEYISYI